MQKTMIISALLVLLAGGAAAEKKFMVDSTFYNNTSAEINDVKILNAQRTTPLREVGSNFTIEALQNDSNISINGPVPLSFITNVRTTKGGYTVQKSKVNKMIYLEYSRNITKIQLTINGEVKASFDLIKNFCSSFDDQCISYCNGKGVDVDCTCGDNICQESTNEEELCPQDCTTRENDTETEKNNTQDGQVKEVVDSSYSTYILIIIAAIAVLLAIFLLSGKVKIEA